MPQTTPTVHVVDDDDSYRRSTARLLKAAGFSVCTYASADEYLAGSEHHRGCVLLDVHMPGISGLELQAQLAARGSTVPIIFVTADPNERVARQAIAAGALALLAKPAPIEQLLALLRQVLAA